MEISTRDAFDKKNCDFFKRPDFLRNKLVKDVRIGQKIRENSELFCVVKPLDQLKYLDNEKKNSRK